ncbi:MAG: hypothetical protein JNJ73_06975 [Hyphomonadaceae bacterium]|nr:hypothetical protein [Hyphomonadaceae bacterium]
MKTFAAIAVLALACAGCATSEPVEQAPLMAEPTDPMAAPPEFHGASIGRDSLRSVLDVE